MSRTQWWRRAVFYQVYVWSFADADGDGIGDLPGVRSRLPYLRDLGVDAVWLNPFYPSPQADNGYDVADHRDVDPRFGTIADADALIRDAHALGLRIVIDLVPNHTSDEHPWFRAALADGPGSAARRRYLFRDGRGPAGDQPPNNWTSNFGGRAWTRAPDGQWYLHLFAPEQPDLDWTSDEVRAEFHSILRFWLDRGVDGFRIDVAHGLAKDPQMPDLGEHLTRPGAAHPHWDVDEVHDVYRGWRRVLDDYPGDRMFVGEIVVQSVQRLALYLRPDELHTAFNFALLKAPWDATALRTAIDDSIGALETVGAPPTWVLSNHDEVRHVTRYGGGPLGVRRARAAALMMLALPGGAYLYQGDELGLPEVEDLPDRVRRDPVFYRTGGAERGRDGCRVPLPWSGSAPSLGFGPGHESWLPQPSDWKSLTVERQTADPGSTLNLHRAALSLRHQIPALATASLTWLPAPEGVLAFRRGPAFRCVVNLNNTPVRVDPAELLLASDPYATADTVPGESAAWYMIGW
ncbi:glycoside hydrolase family 13 protein [Actinoplanes bogorensis]|uniref:Glycoside hydrolase family 13 protein n=1 Tax=Paractinoplanes bogorensis TaxID=1610840 RepID=A0ABS5YZS4_9ACTN|nr:glycoside hydrolase family 13 protein [Actinoplanes bogorensis]MBU2668947.1 glycoside hydrolase family 13 protein [Actinoplanes bogorensis]